jgi:hypothetical protein
MSFFGTLFHQIDRFRKLIHILQALLVLAAFSIGCALLANSSMPRSRSTTLILVYVSAASLLSRFQIARFRRFLTYSVY